MADLDWANARIILPPYFIDPTDGTIASVFERHRHNEIDPVFEKNAIMNVVVAVLGDSLQIGFFRRLVPTQEAK
jgi:hypothetical protein